MTCDASIQEDDRSANSRKIYVGRRERGEEREKGEEKRKEKKRQNR